jgi:hypothetical protein
LREKERKKVVEGRKKLFFSGGESRNKVAPAKVKSDNYRSQKVVAHSGFFPPHHGKAEKGEESELENFHCV